MSDFETFPVEPRPIRPGHKSEFQIFRNSEPVVNEGNIASVYEQPQKILPQRLEPTAFQVEAGIASQALNDDMDLRGGMSIFFSREKGKSPNTAQSRTYYVVDAGLAHLPGLYEMMLGYNIDPAMVITETPKHTRFQETLKYWSTSVARSRSKMEDDKVDGFATLVDCHREKPVDRELIPTADSLRSLGVTRVVYLSESPVGEYSANVYPKDIEKPMTEFKEAGFAVESFGIDRKQGFRKQK